MGESNRVVVARADVALAPFAPGGAPGTFVDVGYTREVAGMEASIGMLETECEQTLMAVDVTPIKQEINLSFHLLEAKTENLARYLQQIAGDLSGVDPNKVLILNEPWRDGLPQLWQVRFTTKGTKLTTDPTKVRATRTITYWKCYVQGLGNLQFGKSEFQSLPIKARVLHDESSTTTLGIYGKIADTGGT